MGGGIRSLNMIARTAPMLGGLALMDGLRQALVGWPPPANADVAGGWSEMFVPFAIGIAAASLAIVCHQSLSAWIERFRTETRIATLQLLNELVRPSTNN